MYTKMGVFSTVKRRLNGGRGRRQVSTYIRHGLGFGALFSKQLTRCRLKLNLVFPEGLQWPHQEQILATTNETKFFLRSIGN